MNTLHFKCFPCEENNEIINKKTKQMDPIIFNGL